MSKIFSFAVFFVIVTQSFASSKKVREEPGLPYEPDTTEMSLQPIGSGKSVKLEFYLNLPKTQQLNKGAGSFVGIYERQKREKWQVTQKIDLNTVFNVNGDLNFSKQIELKSADSEVALFSTIFHCGKDHKTACFIQGFRGITSRSKNPKATHTIPFYVEGSMR